MFTLTFHKVFYDGYMKTEIPYCYVWLGRYITKGETDISPSFQFLRKFKENQVNLFYISDNQ